jgi:2-polyprenyl-3-methyl-5-hydroxy-6-metoxy-1,4-benzoquinol methylase
MKLAPDENTVERIKQTERTWHDSHYEMHAEYAYPETLEDFERIFVKGQISCFCDGGWSWLGDARREAIDAVGDVSGLRVLDYGCGYGGLGLYLSLKGAQVWGFDLSLPAVGTANRAAQRYGLAADFAQMDASDLTYPDEFFDLVIGFGVLHHVIKYPGTDSHLLRILKPRARAVFHETLWDNPLINFARRFTTAHSDAGDTALTDHEIRRFCQEFSHVQLEKRHLLYMLKRLAKLPPTDWNAPLALRPFWRAMKALDHQILQLAPLRCYCGEVVVYLQK